MDTYIISLKKNHERCEHSIKKLQDAGINNVNKFDAINGNELIPTLDPIEYKHPFVNVSLACQYDLYNGRKQHREIPSKGGIGCYLSHITLWKKLVESDKDYMLIFEDDVVPLYENLDIKIKELMNERNDFDILLLGYSFIKDKKITSVSKYLNKCIFFFGLFSYIITKKAAKELLEYVFPIEMQIDSYISYYNFIRDKNFNIYFAKNKLFRFSIEKSDVQDLCLSCLLLEYKEKNYNSVMCILFFLVFMIFIWFVIYMNKKYYKK